MRKCYGCKKVLTINDFYKSVSDRGGRARRCKDCDRLRNRERRKRNPDTFKRKDENYYKKHREEILQRRKDWYKNNKHKVVAHEAVKRALYKGRLRKSPCEVCGKKNSQAHHEDYSKPLDVAWLCPEHHRLRELKEE